MRHRKLSKRLSRPTAHRKALVSNLVKSLFEYERICTTLPKAKVASSFADRMITLAKKKDLAAIRKAISFLGDKDLVKKLFKEIGPRFQDRKGGYTRVIRLDRRPGDRAFMAVLELVSLSQKTPSSEEAQKQTKTKKKGKTEEAKVS